MVQRMRPFIDEISNAARGLSEVIHQIEGGMRVVEDLDGVAEPRHVSQIKSLPVECDNEAIRNQNAC